MKVAVITGAASGIGAGLAKQAVARGMKVVLADRDQAGLDVAQRAANRRASMSVRARAPRTVLLVDDIITTGATLSEASRALQQAGHTVLGAAVVAATPRTGAHT